MLRLFYESKSNFFKENKFLLRFVRLEADL